MVASAKSRKKKQRVYVGLREEYCECGGEYCPKCVPLGYAVRVVERVWFDYRDHHPWMPVKLIGYDCYVNSMAKLGDHEDDKFQSSSAAANDWMYSHRIDNSHEIELLPETDGAIQWEVALYESFMTWLDETEGDEEARTRKRKRYLSLVRQFGENRRRLYQWLRNEFQGWLA